MEVVLSDGTILDISDDTPEDQVRVQIQQAEQQLAPQASADNGTTPAPVDDSWFPEGEKFPGYTIGHEFLTGVAKGVGDLPNAVPNVVNASKSL